MRWAILSDIHGNLPALEAVLAVVAAEGIEQVVQLGDALSGPLWPAETADRLMQLAWPAIAGNHERQVLTLPLERMGHSDRHAAERLNDSQRAWMRALPATRWLDEDVFCCHGTPASDLQYFLDTVTPDHGDQGSRGVRPAREAEVRERLGATRASLVACGHTHVPRIVQVTGGPLVLNPGSVGLPGFDDAHPHFHIVENGAPHARWALAERDEASGNWSVALQATAYDWQAAAARAQANGRGDWADAIATGFVGRLESDVT